MPELERILKVHYAHKPQELIDLDKDYDPTNRFSEKDNILITYGDLVSGEGHSPLAILGEFLKRTRLSEVFSKSNRCTVDRYVSMVKCLKHFDQDLVNPASAGENLAWDIIRASFSQERMTYFPEDSKVVYRSKDGKEEKIFDALEWLAAM